MKKIIVSLLAVTVLLSITACKPNATNGSSSEQIIGIASQASQEESNSESSAIESAEGKDNQTATSFISSGPSPESSSNSTINTPITNIGSANNPQPSHSHSYSNSVTAPTCTTQGYTTYTCSCGDSYIADYIQPSHNYSKFKCDKCGQIDKSHSYEYFVEWIKDNGTSDGSSVTISYYENDEAYYVTYETNEKRLAISFLDPNSSSAKNDDYYISLSLSDYSYGSILGYSNEICLMGNINAANLTANTPLTYTHYSGDAASKDNFIELSRLGIDRLVCYLEYFLDKYAVGITIADLGFTSY